MPNLVSCSKDRVAKLLFHQRNPVQSKTPSSQWESSLPTRELSHFCFENFDLKKSQKTQKN